MLTTILIFSIQIDQQQSFLDSITELIQADQKSSKYISIQFFKSDVQQLSARELEVLKLVAEGYSNPEIALKLYVSQNTVKTHIRSLMNKFGVDRRVQLATVALTQGQDLKDMLHG